MRERTNASHDIPDARSTIVPLRRIHDVLIRPVRPERRLRLDVPQPVNDLRHRVMPAGPEEVRARQPAAVREQVADGQLARRVRIVELELGDVVGDVVVPVQLPVVDEHRERRRRHRLRRRSDRKPRVLVGRLVLAHLEHAIALGKDERVVLHDRDRECRHLPIVGGLRHVTIERRPIGRRRLLCARRRGGDQHRAREGADAHDTLHHSVDSPIVELIQLSSRPAVEPSSPSTVHSPRKLGRTSRRRNCGRCDASAL